MLLILLLSSSIAIAELPSKKLDQLRQATVFIKVATADGMKGSGTGFFVQDKLIVTNAHVLMANDPWQVVKTEVDVVKASGTSDQQNVRCSIASIDVPRDIAFLRVLDGTQAPVIKLVKSDTLTETMPVYVLGFPLGNKLDLAKKDPALTVVSGHISNFRRDEHQFLDGIQVNATLIPGNSGGPIVDSQGQLVGVSRATVLGTKLGFAIPADQVEEDMRGRICAVELATSKEKASIKVNLRTVDPLKRIEKLAAYYWTSDKNSQRPLVPGTKIETHGARGDSPRKHVQLALDDTSDSWSALIPLTNIPENRELWIQSAIASGDGVRMTAAINYSRDYRDRQQAKQAVEDASKSGQLKEFHSKWKPGSQPAVTPANVRPIHFASRIDAKDSDAMLSLESKAQRVTLHDKAIIDIVPAPQGHCFYVIFENEPQVWVFDSADFKLITKIDVAKSPESIGCQGDKLAVACKDSQVIQFVDTKKHEVVQAVRIPDRNRVPTKIVGEASDGSLMTLWTLTNDVSAQALYLIGTKRPPLKLVEGNIEWCALLPDAGKLIVQSSDATDVDYPGHPKLWTIDNNPEKTELEFTLKGKSAPMQQSGRCFVNRNGDQLYVPTIWFGNGSKQITLILKTEGSDTSPPYVPGFALPQPGPNGTCISFDFERRQRAIDGLVYVANPISETILKQIRIKGLPESIDVYFDFHTHRHVEFIPGRELMLIVDPEATGVVCIAACAAP